MVKLESVLYLAKPAEKKLLQQIDRQANKHEAT